MASQRTRSIVLLCLLVGTLLGAVTMAGAAPPPRPLCDACGDSFEDTAESHDVSLTVENSTATVTVHENGSATWVVHNHVARTETTARLRSNEATLRTIAVDVMRDAEFRGASISAAGVITMRYREPEFAKQSVGGVLRSGTFTQAYGYRNLDGLGADRLTVIAPSGTQVDWTVPGASVSENRNQMTITELDDGGFVTFVPRSAAVAPVLSFVAIGALLGPVIVINALIYVTLPTVVFAILIGAAVGILASDWEYGRIQNWSFGLGVYGLLVTAASVVALGGGSVLLGGTAAPLLGIGLTLVMLGVVCAQGPVRDRLTYRRLVGMAALGAGVASVVTVAGATAGGQSEPTRALLSNLPFLLPVFLLIPAGYALGRANRRFAIGTAAVGFALSLIPLAPYTSPTIGNGVLLTLSATMYAVIIAIGGIPLLVVGASIARQTTAEH